MISLSYLLGTSAATTMMVLFDKYLPSWVQGKYYLVHAVVNFIILLNSGSDMINTYLNFDESMMSTTNFIPAMLVYSLHFYHMIAYYNKLRFDDWLHHILMVFVSLPIASFINSGTLLNHSLFFLCGLPGMIDYFLLFLVRNKYIDRMTEKKVNKHLNLWIRAPGCISHTVLTIIAYMKYKDSLFNGRYDFIAMMITAVLVYWNGVYFMEQVVSDYKKNEIKNKKIDINI